jgi:hypothetical protein
MVEPIPIVADLNEATPIGLKAFADDVANGQTTFTEQLPRDRSAAMDELGTELNWGRGTGVSYRVYSSTDPFPRFEDNGPEAAPGKVAGGREASRAGADDDDVSRGRHG